MRSFLFRAVALCVVLSVVGPAYGDGEPIFKVPEDKAGELRERDKQIKKDGPGLGDPGALDGPIGDVDDGLAGAVSFWDQSLHEAKTLEYMLTADAWHYRVFGLMRLERFVGEEVSGCVVRAMDDPAWQVRCFALRAAARGEIAIPEGQFDKEPEARVIRMAQRIGVPVPLNQVRLVAGKEMRSRMPERVVLGIEIAARSGDEKLLKQAKRRLSDLLMKMNNAVLVTIGDRLAALMQVPPMTSVAAWQQHLKAQGKGLAFPEFALIHDQLNDQPIAPIAMMDTKAFLHTVDYLDAMHTQDLQIAVVIDGTGSMGHVIHRAQGQTNRLMLTLNDLAKSMEMGVVIYRDKGDKPMLEAVQMSGKLSKVRSFLFDVTARGGGDTPEAVHEGLYALNQLDWSSKAVKQAVLIADAPAHEDKLAAVEEITTDLRNRGITVNALLIGSNTEAKETLEGVAEWGGGELLPLDRGDDLAKLVFHLVIEPQMHATFDHLYDLYVELGL